MKTRKDAERVVELSDKRERLHKVAATIRMADDIRVCNGNPNGPWRHGEALSHLMQFVHLTGELRELVRRELQEQTTVIDRELEALGVAPDEFETEEPNAGEEVGTPVKIEVIPSRRGTVSGRNEIEAIAKAIEEFEVTAPTDRKRLRAQRTSRG